MATPCVLAAVFLTSPRAQSQTGDKPLPREFEVASIKPAAPGSRFSGGYFIAPGGRFIGENITVERLIEEAYDTRSFQVSGGPGWIGSERYDINAKAEGWTTPAQLRPLVQALLADRFKLKIHRDTKELPLYALIIAKNGPKLSPSADNLGPRIGGGRGRIKGQQISMPMFAGRLAQQLGRPVVDKTGLKGEYDIVLEWTPDARAPEGAEPADLSGPSIFTALQEQLGLKLEGQKGPVEIPVIDNIERASAN